MQAIHTGGMVIHMDKEEEETWELALTKALKAERAASGMTQDDLAAKAGMPSVTYQRYESGKRVPTAIQVMAVADALGIGFPALAERIEKRIQEARMERMIAAQKDVDLAAYVDPDPTEDERLRQEHPDDESI